MSRSRDRSRARPSGAAPQFTPASLPSLAAWFDAARGITLNGSNVSAWADQSGNGRHVAQGTAGNQPGYTTVDATFGSCLTFDGGDWLDALASWGLSQPITIYVVGIMANGADYQTFFDAGAGARVIVRVTAAESLSMFSGTANIEPGASVASASIVCSVFNGASSAGYVNNVTASVTGNPGTGGLGTPRIGAAPASVYPMLTGGKIAQTIVFNAAHDAATRALMFRYLVGRYPAITVTGL